MKFRRSICCVLLLALCLGLLSGISLQAGAEEVDYVTGSKGYIYNWGTRGETATFLSPNAKSFYAENGVTYDSLAALSGSTSTSSVPSSALYLKLQELMADNHDTYTNYADTRSMYAYTDCQGNDGSKVSCIYCGEEFSSKWDYGETWNREHTWPKSKSLNGSTWDETAYSDETDLMMLRPACPEDNTARSYYAYNNSTGSYYFYPNLSEDIDVRGDVARSVLYGYVRWGNTGKMWGSYGVIASVDVLLQWMEEDPVDTWEMGRNDSVESILGTRNVFIDYPELAFLMFGQSLPVGWTTPSNSGDTVCVHEDSFWVDPTAATCTQSGNTGGYYCNDCESYYGDYTVIEPLGHSWKELVCTGGSVCTVCGAQEEGGTPRIVTAPAVGTAYKLGMDKKDGVIRYFNGSTESSSVSYRLAVTTNIEEAVDVYLESASGGYRLYYMNGSTKTYIRLYQYKSGSAGAGTGSLALTTTTPTEVMGFDSTARTLIYTYSSSNAYYMGTYSSYTTISASNTSYITGSNASKVDVSQYPARFYQLSVGEGHKWEEATCTTPKTCTVCGATEGELAGHSWQAATCTAPKTCTECGATEGEKTEHSFRQGACAGCGLVLSQVADLNSDGKLTAFDAQILAEARAGSRTLTEAQWTALEQIFPEDILQYILGK